MVKPSFDGKVAVCIDKESLGWLARVGNTAADWVVLLDVAVLSGAGWQATHRNKAHKSQQKWCR